MLDPIFAPNLDSVIEELDLLFPDKYPDYLLSDKEICYRAGQVSVIRYLKEKFIED